jgi:hypothetical protein
MKRKQSTDRGAPPKQSGSRTNQEKEQDYVYHMKDQVRGVVARCMGTEKLHIGHVRNPRQRMPVGHYRGAEGPRHVVKRKALLDGVILSDVTVVVVIHESVRKSRPVREYRERRERRGYKPR